MIKITVGQTEFEIIANGFEKDFASSGHPAVSITAVAPNREKKDCYWWYEYKHKGVYKFDDGEYDPSNCGHENFCEWLQQNADCCEDEAIEAMGKILDMIDTGDKCADDDLYGTYIKNTTEIIVDSGCMLSNRAAHICKTEDGDYIGAIFDEDELETLIEMTLEDLDDVCKKIEVMQFDDADRTATIMKAVEKAAEYED